MTRRRVNLPENRKEWAVSLMFKGIAVSPGVVVGTAHRVEAAFGTGETKRLDDAGLVPREIARFEQAIEESAAELGGLVVKVAEQLGHSAQTCLRDYAGVLAEFDPDDRVSAEIAIERARGAT